MIVAVIPTLNEAKHIEAVVQGTLPHVDRLLVTDDHSSDGTYLLALDAGAHVATNEGRRGYGSNILHGIGHARQDFKADVIVILDGDGQHDPGEIPLLLAPLKADQADVVMGCRVNGHGMPGYRRLGNRILSFTCNAGAKQVLPDALSGFWAIRTCALPELTERRWGLAIELLIKTRASGWRLGGVPVRPIYHGNYADNSTTTPLYLAWALLRTIVKWRVRVEVLKNKVPNPIDY
jgi:glycosyltransferase involved in cell wall biosynthesis